MVYNKTYYIQNREKIRIKYDIRAQQKKRRVLVLAELLRVTCIHEQEIPAKPKPRVPTNTFNIVRKPVMIYF